MLNLRSTATSYLVTIIVSVLVIHEIISPIIGFVIAITTLIYMRMHENKQINKQMNDTLIRYSDYYTIEKGRGDYLVLKINNNYNSQIPEWYIDNDPHLKDFVYGKLIIEIEKIRRHENLNNIASRFKKM